MHDGKIWITDWNSNRHEMTPDEFVERIRNDSDSNWDWLAPTAEIVKTISDPEFPEPIANEIKGLVLKRFARLLLSGIGITNKSTDQLAVAYCYYSVHGKTGKQIKRLYRENLLKFAVEYSYIMQPFGANGKEWHTFRDNWKKDALQHFTKRFGIDFMRFETNIRADYIKSVQRADKAGEFDNDKAEHEKFAKRTADRIMDYFGYNS